MRTLIVALLGALVFTLTAPVASAQDEDIDSYITLMRTDLLAQRGVLIINNMQFTEAESEVFWPVYHKYQHELTPIGNDRADLIKDYLANVDRMDDEKAKELMRKVLELEERRIAVMKKYIEEFSKVLPAKRVAQLFQLELQMERLIDVRISSRLPLLKK